MFVEIILSSGQIAGALTAVAGILWGIWRFILKPIVFGFAERWGEFLAKVDAVPQLLQHIDTLTKQIDLSNEHNALSLKEIVQDIQHKLRMWSHVQEFMLIDAGISTFLSNANGEFVAVNREFINLTRKSKEELLNNGWISLLTSSDDKTEITNAWEDAWTKQIDIVLPAVTLHLLDNTQIDVRFVAYKITNAKGDFIGHQGFVKRLDVADKAIKTEKRFKRDT